MGCGMSLTTRGKSDEPPALRARVIPTPFLASGVAHTTGDKALAGAQATASSPATEIDVNINVDKDATGHETGGVAVLDLAEAARGGIVTTSAPLPESPSEDSREILEEDFVKAQVEDSSLAVEPTAPLWQAQLYREARCGKTPIMVCISSVGGSSNTFCRVELVSIVSAPWNGATDVRNEAHAAQTQQLQGPSGSQGMPLTRACRLPAGPPATMDQARAGHQHPEVQSMPLPIWKGHLYKEVQLSSRVSAIVEIRYQEANEYNVTDKVPHIATAVKATIAICMC
eukprot:scaffold181019_cov36-Tisochrysis_lutea.AAC.1